MITKYHDETLASAIDRSIEEWVKKDLPVESTLCDEMGLFIKNQQNKIDTYKKQIKVAGQLIKDEEFSLRITKEKMAEYMQNMGVDKLNGLAIKTIYINKAHEPTIEKTTKQVFECDLTKKQIEEFLVLKGVAEYKDIEVEKATMGREAFITVKEMK